MSMTSVSCFVVVVVVCLVLCALGVGGAGREEFEGSDEVLIRRLVDPGNGGVDEYTAELIWDQCRRFKMHAEVVKGLDKISLHAEEINLECCSSARDIIQRIFLAPYPQLKRSLLNCLKENNLLLLVSGEDFKSKSWYTGYLKYIVPGLRWNLRRELVADTPSLAPSLAPAPGPSTGSPQPSPAPSPALGPQLPFSPAPSVPPPFFPAVIHSPPPQGVNLSESTDTTSDVQGKGHNGNNRTVIAAVVVTAAVTFIAASLIFLCWSKIRKARSGDRRNDERPLLSLSMSDYSMSSSHKPFALGNSLKEDTLGHQTYDINASHNGKFSQNGLYDTTKYSSASYGLSDHNNVALSASIPKPTSGLPPLKPPPGRISALPPEPPASLKPQLFKGNSSPPPPVPPPARPAHTESGPPLPGSLPAPIMPSGARPPPPPPVPSSTKPGPPPPPPPKSGAPPRPPPPGKAPRPPPIGGKNQSSTANDQGNNFSSEDVSKPKLKPFFWDKVQANPDHSMVWNQIKSGSFQFNEEEIETLFGYGSAEKNNNKGKNDSSTQEGAKFIQIIDSKKAQNLSILLRALNVTLEEVCDALHEGNELPVEFLQTVLKMAPTADEELKLRLFSGELSQLGPADRFLKAMADIPFAFKRFEALLFMSTLQEDVTITKESFATLEVACKELRNSRFFLKLLEAVLKTGNRMNDGTFRGGALAFKLDTLLKLSDVKGVDGKTTLLHFVVQEIIRSEGMRAAHAARESQSSSSIKSDDIPEVTSSDSEEHYRRLGLQVVSNLGSDLENVKKAAVLDADSLTGTVSKLGSQLVKTRNFFNTEIKTSEEDNGFSRTLKCFIQSAENDIKWLQEEDQRIMALVKSTGDYFHGKAGKDEGLRLFVIVRDFLIMLDKACKEVKVMEAARPRWTQKKEKTVSSSSSSEPRQPPSPDIHRRLFPAIADRRINYSSSDDEDA